MPLVLKIDGSLVQPLEDRILDCEVKIRKSDNDVVPGTSVFVWSHYSQPKHRDGKLLALGVVVLAERSNERTQIRMRVAISSCPTLRDWHTADLDQLKGKGDSLPETEIADEIRGYTHEHVGHVSDAAGALMASYFI